MQLGIILEERILIEGLKPLSSRSWVYSSFSSRSVTRVSGTIVAERGLPHAIRCEKRTGPDTPAFAGVASGPFGRPRTSSLPCRP